MYFFFKSVSGAKEDRHFSEVEMEMVNIDLMEFRQDELAALMRILIVFYDERFRSYQARKPKVNTQPTAQPH